MSQTAHVSLLSNATGLATPVNAAFVQADTGGTLVASTTYFYRVSATNAAGETLASTETSLATSATAPATHTMTVNWAAVTGATGYKVYGRTTGAEQLIAAVGNVLTYIDTGAITPSGALPAANTTNAPGVGQWPGGKGVFAVKASGYGTVDLQFQLPDAVTWVTPASGSLTADGGIIFELPPCPIRATPTSATAVTATATRIPE